MRAALLLSSRSLSEAQRWALVSSLYDQVRSFIEGSCALLATLAICASYTGWRGYWAMAGITGLITIIRLAHWRCFVLARRAGRQGARSPDAWARDATIGICTMAALWSATVVSLTIRSDDTRLLLFVIIIQTGWLAGAGVRNAASPAALLGQTLIIMLPTIACAFFGMTGLLRFLSLASVVFMRLLLKVTRFNSAQLLSLMEAEQRLTVANTQLLTLSCTDGLTGLANRRAFDERFAAAWALAVREAREIAVVLIDVDHFKRYNDHYGHLAGDDCLRAVAEYVGSAVLRASDLPARYGGEEFVLLLPGTSDHGAAEVADRLCRAVHGAGMPHEASPFGRVTVTAGVASLAPGLHDTPAMLIARADQALYLAKENGRNQVSIAAPAPPVRGGAAAFPRLVAARNEL
jgi:diguanylate cyclase (GGDEF)-like protein